MIKGSIQEEGIIPVNIYTSNSGEPNYIKQILADIKGETDNNTTIIEDFINTLITIADFSRWKINKKRGLIWYIKSDELKRSQQIIPPRKQE